MIEVASKPDALATPDKRVDALDPGAEIVENATLELEIKVDAGSLVK